MIFHRRLRHLLYKAVLQGRSRMPALEESAGEKYLMMCNGYWPHKSPKNRLFLDSLDRYLFGGAELEL
jgi:hypothetical protein